MTGKDSASLFSGRVQNYIQYRPAYPASVMDLLATRCGLTSHSVIADIGSGTGILTELFLKAGNPVFAVEPNDEMRAAAEKLLGRYPNFTSVSARAEATRLPDHSVELVTAAQAFHWFDHPSARLEFIRILKRRGWAVLLWNMARTDTPFLKEYDEFWRIDLRGAHEARDGNEALVQRFFGGAHYEKVLLEGLPYDLTLDEFTGRILSISAAIQPGEAGYEAFMQKVRGMFERHRQNNRVRMSYNTEVFLGQFA